MIELLAVILVLGIIALIAIPSVTKLIDQAKIKSFKETNQSIVKVVGDDCSKKLLTGDSIIETYNISNRVIDQDLDIKGKLPTTGAIVVDNICNVQLSTNDGKYCAIKTYEDDIVKVGYYDEEGCKIDNKYVEIDPSDGTCPTVHKPDPEYTKEELDAACSISDKPVGDILYCSQNNITPTDESNFGFDSATGTITSYTGTSKEVVIPCTIGGTKVSNIDDGTFSSLGLTKIVFNDNIKTIGAGTFNENLLTELYFTDSLENIGSSSFNDNLLNIVSFGVGTKTIGSGFFKGPNKIEHLYFNGDNPTMYYGAFVGTKIKKLTIGSGIKTINTGAFSDNEIEELEFNEGINTINESSFVSNQISSICFPKSLNTIGLSAFSNNGLSKVYFQEGLTTIKTSAFNYNNISYLYLPDSLSTMEGSAFAQNPLETIVMGNGVTNLDYTVAHAFNSTVPIKYAYLDGNDVYIFGIALFNNSSSIEHLAFGPGVRKIENFQGRSIKELELNNNISEISQETFWSNDIPKICIPKNISIIDSVVFKNNKITKLTIPDNITYIGNETFRENQIQYIKLPDHLETIASAAFADNQIEELTIPSSVTEVFTMSFLNNKISKLNINSNSLSIYGGAFNGNLLPDSKAFVYLNGLSGDVLSSYGGNSENIIIPDGVKTIDYSALAYDSFKTITIPSSVTTINVNALSDTPNLTTIINKGSLNIDWSKVLGKGTTDTCTFIQGTCGGIAIRTS